MKAYLLKAAMLLAASSFLTKSYGQRHLDYVSHNPIRDLGTAQNALFNLPAEDSAYYFRADLPGDNFLVIRFGKLSYWHSGILPEVFGLARQSWKQVEDSFAGNTTARRLSLHVPPSNYPVIADLAEYGKDNKTMLIKGQLTQPLRIAIDTLNVLKSFPPNAHDTSSKPQVQYTFLLKDLSEIDLLASNEELVNNLEHTFDSLVTSLRADWKHQDAFFHNIQAHYDVRQDERRKLKTTYPGTFVDNFEYTGELGVSFIANNISPIGALKLSYLVSRNTFVSLSFSGIGFVHEANRELSLSSLGFLNAEIGSRYKGSGPLPLYRTSVGFGYRVDKYGPDPYDFKYRLFFNYGLTKAISIASDTYIVPKKGDNKATGFIGITIAMRIL